MNSTKTTGTWEEHKAIGDMHLTAYRYLTKELGYTRGQLVFIDPDSDLAEDIQKILRSTPGITLEGIERCARTISVEPPKFVQCLIDTNKLNGQKIQAQLGKSCESGIDSKVTDKEFERMRNYAINFMGYTPKKILNLMPGTDEWRDISKIFGDPDQLRDYEIRRLEREWTGIATILSGSYEF